MSKIVNFFHFASGANRETPTSRCATALKIGLNDSPVQACTRYIIINSVAYIKIDGENLRKEIREDPVWISHKSYQFNLMNPITSVKNVRFGWCFYV